MPRLERLPVRWRLALTSAGLTFAILLLFAVVIGLFTARQVRSSFDDDLRLTAIDLSERIHPLTTMGDLRFDTTELDQAVDSAAGDAVIRIVRLDGVVLKTTDPNADLGPPSAGVNDSGGYRVVTRPLDDPTGQPVALVQYAKPISHLRHTMARIKLFLLFGVIGGSVLALLAGLAIARRAMAPVAKLTSAAQTIARTRDASVHMPKPAADDEVADLARTLEEMLAALDAARAETQSALDRQRRFVADASHELRTPLTSILANLELLEGELTGEDAEIASSALRSSRRMRRLVADLLLLARADAGRVARREPLDIAWVVREAAGEAAPIARGHGLTVDVEPDERLVVEGSADELHRLVLNLVQNALVHTPEGTAVDVRARRDGDHVAIEVSDEGPGVPPEMRDRIFDRFVRAEGDRGSIGPGAMANGHGSGSGLGLAIVRAVAESHGGSVTIGASDGGGAKFTVRLPLAGVRPATTPPPPPPPPAPTPQASKS